MKLSLQLLVIILLASNLLWGQSAAETSEFKKLNADLEQLKKDGEISDAYSKIGEIVKYLQSNGDWKTSLEYIREQAEIGKQFDDPDFEAIPILNGLEIENVLFDHSDDFTERIAYTLKFKNLDIEHETKGRIYMLNSVRSRIDGSKDSSIYFLNEAIKAYDQDQNLLSASISERIRISSLYNLKGKPIQAIDMLLESESMIDSTISSTAKYRVYRGLAWILFDIKDYQKAKFYYQKALDVGIEYNEEEKISEANYGLGKAYSNMEDFDNALQHLLPAIKAMKTSKFNNLLSRCYGVTSFVYLNMDELETAKLYADSLYQFKDNIAQTYDEDMYFHFMTQYLIKKQNPSNARREMSKIKEFDSRKHEYLYKINKLEGNYQKANLYLERSVAAKDSVRLVNEALKVQRIESEFNREQQDNEINSLNALTIAQDKALAVRNTALTLGSIMLAILALLLFSLYRLFLKNQENQQELASQNSIITKALEQNKILIKEIHHRVKNNLQVVSSLLSMQARKTKDGDTKDALNSSKTRVQSMSILHQNLYQGENLTGVNIDEYLDKVVDNIIETYKIQDNITFEVDIDPISLDVDTLVPLGLIANELICNALKYAFIGRQEGKLSVRFKEKGNKIILTIADDGVGFEGNEIPKKEGSLGARLITSFTERLEGELSINHKNGTDISIVFDKEKLGIE